MFDRAWVAAAVAVGLAACEPGPLAEADLEFEPLQGEWSACLDDGGRDRSTHVRFFSDASFRLTSRTYETTDGTCGGAATTVSDAARRYELLADVPSRIGPDGREVVAKQMNIHDSFRTVYTIVFVDREASPAVLYFGDLALDPVDDGTSPSRRPDVLSATTALTNP